MEHHVRVFWICLPRKLYTRIYHTGWQDHLDDMLNGWSCCAVCEWCPTCSMVRSRLHQSRVRFIRRACILWHCLYRDFLHFRSHDSVDIAPSGSHQSPGYYSTSRHVAFVSWQSWLRLINALCLRFRGKTFAPRQLPIDGTEIVLEFRCSIFYGNVSYTTTLTLHTFLIAGILHMFAECVVQFRWIDVSSVRLTVFNALRH